MDNVDVKGKIPIAAFVGCMFLFLMMHPVVGFSWDGIVINKESHSPIAGAVIVRTWERIYATPGGSVSRLIGVKEGKTDTNGKFSVSWQLHFPGIPVINRAMENPSVAYKPGYKFLILKERSNRIELERIPTSKAAREREWKEAERHYDISQTREARGTENFPTRYWDIWEREKEFLHPQHMMTVSLPVGPSAIPKNRMLGSSPSRTSSAQTTANTPSNSSIKQNEKLWCGKDSRVNSECSVKSLCVILADRSQLPSRRSMAAYFLDKSKNPNAISPLLQALQQDEDPNVRASAAFALGTFGESRVIESLIVALGDSDRRVQHKAGEALGIVGEPAVEALILGLKDRVRAEPAANVLGRNRDPRAVEPLIALFNANDEGKASLSAGFALIYYKDPRAAKEFAKALKDENHFFKKEAIRALVLTGDASTDAVVPLLKYSDAKVRRDAGLILGDIKDTKATLPLMASLKDPDVAVRRAVASSLGRLEDARAASDLILAWNDNESGVRSIASESLISIGSPAVKPLTFTLRNMNSYFRWRAAWCLGWIGDISAVDPLVVALNDRVPEVRWTIIEALGRIGDKKSTGALYKLCMDEDEGIRDIAKASLQKIAGGTGCP